MNSSQPVSSFSPDEITKISAFVSKQIGLAYSSDRTADLLRGFQNACKDMGFESPSTCLHLMEDPKIILNLKEQLINKLTIGETYFFRDKNLFLLLRDYLLPDLIRKRRKGNKYIRIWSAGCSTGEEPYSIAIMIRHLITDITDWEISILGTDINPGSLRAAERGIYSKWSFREKNPVPLEKYVTMIPDGRFQLSHEIRKMVQFNTLNLVADCYPSSLTGTTAMDLILCRNVLMYFSPESATNVVDQLSSSLVDKGWFIVSPQEISYAKRPGLQQVKRSSTFLFQKVKKTDKYKKKTITECFPIIPNEMEDMAEPIKRDIPIGFKRRNNQMRRRKPLNSRPSHVRTISSLQRDHSSQSGISPEKSFQLIHNGRMSDADSLLMQIEKPNNQDLKNMEIMARTYADRGDIERALGWCDKILAANPLSPGSYHLKAIIQQEKGLFDDSIRSLRQALYADPDYIPAHLMLGSEMKKREKQSDALRHYQIALSLLLKLPDDTSVDEIDGMPVARLREIVTILLKRVHDT